MTSPSKDDETLFKTLVKLIEEGVLLGDPNAKPRPFTPVRMRPGSIPASETVLDDRR